MISKDFLKEGFVEDATSVHQDHEVQMARKECYHTAENALALHKLLGHLSEHDGLEAWVSAKITLANDYLNTVREHLEYQFMNPDAVSGLSGGVGEISGVGLPIAESKAEEQQGVAKGLDNDYQQGIDDGVKYFLYTDGEGDTIKDVFLQMKRSTTEPKSKEYWRGVVDGMKSVQGGQGVVEGRPKGGIPAPKGYKWNPDDIDAVPAPKKGAKPIQRPAGYDEYIKQGGFQDDPNMPPRRKKGVKEGAPGWMSSDEPVSWEHGGTGVPTGALGAPQTWRATVSVSDDQMDDRLVSVKANNEDEARQKIETWCQKEGIKNPTITINGADRPRSVAEARVGRVGANTLFKAGQKAIREGKQAARNFKDERLKGCRCQKTQGDNKNCPIHGVREGVAEAAKVTKKSVKETSAGSIAGVVNPGDRNKLGVIFGGTVDENSAKRETGLSPATVASYKGKARRQVRDLETHAKNGEYTSTAQNIIRSRQAGLARAKQRGTTQS